MTFDRNPAGICQWCLPDQGPQGLHLAAKLGFDGVEMDMGLNDPYRDLRDPAVLATFLEAKAASGVQTPSLALNGLSLNREDGLDQVRCTIDDAIRIAVQLGAATLQMPSFFDGGMRNDRELRATAAMLRYACLQAAPFKLTVASENQLDAAENEALLSLVAQENFAVYFDVANPALFDGRDGLALLDALYPHICETHVKDHELHGERRCVPLGEGGCRVAEALEMFKARGYTGWLVLENALDEAALEKDAAFIRKHSR